MQNYDGGVVADQATGRPLMGRNVKVFDEETDAPVQVYREGQPASLVTGAHGLIPQFQTEDSTRRVRMEVGPVRLRQWSQEMIESAAAVATANLVTEAELAEALEDFNGNGIEVVSGNVTLDSSGEPIREFFTSGLTTFNANGTTVQVEAAVAIVWRRAGGSWGYQQVVDGWQTPTPTPDTQAPTAGTLTVEVTDVKADLTVTGATDDRGVTGYAFQVNGGAWSSWQTSPSYTATGLTPSTSYTFRHKVRDAAGNETQGTVVSEETAAVPVAPPVRSEIEAAYLADSPVYYLIMQGETVANMGSATGAAFEVSGTTPTVAMPDGGTGRQFDGTTGVIRTTSGPSIGDTTTGFTLEATFVSPGGTSYLIGNHSTITPQIATNSVGVYINAGDTLIMASTPVDKITHLVMTYDGQTIRRYENGVETHTKAASGAFAGGMPIIGDRQNGGRRFVGVMRDVAVYASVLSPARVLAHAQAQKVA